MATGRIEYKLMSMHVYFDYELLIMQTYYYVSM